MVWIPTILVIFIWTFLHSENPLYRIAEHVFVAAGAGHFIVMGITAILTMAPSRLAKGQFVFLIPLVMGMLMFAIYSKRGYWLSRYPVGLMVGVGTGLALRGTPSAQILGQIAPTVSMLGKDLFEISNNVIVFVATATALTYFIFTRKQGRTLGLSTKIGRYFLMVAFGASYGGTVMSRLAAFVPQMQTLLSADNVLATVVVVIWAFVVLLYRSKKKAK